MVPLLLAVATVTFFLMHTVKGGPFDSDKPLSPAARENLDKRYGLDKPLIELDNQLIFWYRQNSAHDESSDAKCPKHHD
jgi:ABC-type dipeptide/oligopeptide/nickel transport system permease component